MGREDTHLISIDRLISSLEAKLTLHYFDNRFGLRKSADFSMTKGVHTSLFFSFFVSFQAEELRLMIFCQQLIPENPFYMHTLSLLH